MILAVINGYYRSGTTLFHKLLRHKYFVLDEPLHNCFLSRETFLATLDYSVKLHGFNSFEEWVGLFDEYSKIYRKCYSRWGYVDLVPLKLEQVR